MHLIDYAIFGTYLMAMLGIGFYFLNKNNTTEDYFVGSRSMSSTHIGLSIVATDVGGGFSIGLGGLGFTMGIAGSWLLFTGLVGAWMSAVLIIPKIKKIDSREGFLTYPDFLKWRYNKKVAVIAAIISGLGYLGFTAGQILAGAKLSSSTILDYQIGGLTPLMLSILTIGVITIGYTVLGGIKAVVFTDAIQWIVLLVGLIFVTIPAAVIQIGGFGALAERVPASHFSLTNLSPSTFINWMITVIPIWSVGMTLYQRMYACKNVKEAKRAWYIAGLFEYPAMAFAGVFLGICGRAYFPGAESEMALPLLIKHVLPVGVTGIVIAAYFSAIMSTADSCLMAASGHCTTDLAGAVNPKLVSGNRGVRVSMISTLVVGVLAILLAIRFTSVLNTILYSYSFMVSGLLVPTVGAYFWKRGTSKGALVSMLCGGTTTLLIAFERLPLPGYLLQLNLNSAFYGILISLITFVTVSLLTEPEKRPSFNQKPTPPPNPSAQDGVG
ncbi:sodium:solute symporter family protein [Myxococcota bacterium]|nr:sodium:solute symporter family protein [Myxococcota bacterium]